MGEKMCNQANCSNQGSYRYTWPGKDEAHICETCAPKLRRVAQAIGLHVQLIPLEPAT
jgi:hypothetical protein